jgi:hypothetical protein
MDNSGHGPDRRAQADRGSEAGRGSEADRESEVGRGSEAAPGSGVAPGSEGAPEAEVAPRDLPQDVAELVGEVTEAPSRWWPRRVGGRIAGIAGRSGRVSWRGARSGGRWLTSQVLAMAPRLPVRDQARLRAQFPGLGPEELAESLILGASRSAAAVGAASGAAMVLPLPSAPVEIAVETLSLVGIEIKLVAELHEVYGMRAPGSTTDRMLAYVGAWAHRRGVALAPAGIVLVAGSPLRRQLQRRLLARAGRSALSLGPLLTGAIAGAALNRRETGRLGNDVRDDLRRRSPYTSHWAR